MEISDRWRATKTLLERRSEVGRGRSTVLDASKVQEEVTIALSRVDEVDDYPSYLHAEGTLNTKAYVRKCADITGEPAIENPHTISFEIVVPFEYKNRNDLLIKEKEKIDMENQQLDHERELREIEKTISQLNDSTTETRVMRSITDNDTTPAGITRVQEQKQKRQKQIKGALSKLDKAKERVQIEIHRKSLLARADGKKNKRAQAMACGRTLYYGQTIMLRHHYTGRFLSVDQTKISALDKAHLDVSIAGHGSKESIFKVLPRFKVRNEGDAVRAGDAILLKSMDATGQHLSYTPETFGAETRVGESRLHQVGDHEASCCAVPQAWEIELMSKSEMSVASRIYSFSGSAGKQVSSSTIAEASKANDISAAGGKSGKSGTATGFGRADSLHIGDVVYFHHRELEQYFSVNKDTGKAYSRKLRGVDSLWQICRQSTERRVRGGNVHWNNTRDEPFCLRHLQTGEYLCSTKDRGLKEGEESLGKVSAWDTVKKTLLRTDVQTTTVRSSPFTRFSFTSVKETEGSVVHDGAVCRIRNDERNMFVHLWQQHLGMTDHLAVHLTAESSFEDVFQVKKVDYEYLQDVYRIQGACEVPQQLLKALSDSKHGSLLDKHNEEHVDYLMDFEKDNDDTQILQITTQCFKMLQSYLTSRTMDDVERQNARRKIVWATQSGAKHQSVRSAMEQRKANIKASRKKDKASRKVEQDFALSLQRTSMVRLAIMIIHKTASCKSASTLKALGKRLQMDHGNNPLAQMFESVFGFLDAASRNPDLTTLHPEGFIKRTLQSYYRTIGTHLLFFNSKNAGKLLNAITNDEQDLHNAERLEYNGDFGWLLEFLSHTAHAQIGKIVPANYYAALAGLCINGKYASSSSQKLIASRLVEADDMSRDDNESVLDAYRLVESKWMKVSKFADSRKELKVRRVTNTKMKTAKEDGVPDILDPLTRSAVKVIERMMYAYHLKKLMLAYLLEHGDTPVEALISVCGGDATVVLAMVKATDMIVKTDLGLFRHVDADPDLQASTVDKAKARSSPTRPAKAGKKLSSGNGGGATTDLRYAPSIESRVARLEKDANGDMVAVFNFGGSTKKIAINAPDDDNSGVATLCHVVNPERNAGCALQYKEPSLAHEDEYFLLESQLAMMAALCKNRSDAKPIVEQFYCGEDGSVELLFNLMCRQESCHGLRIEALHLLHELRVDKEFKYDEDEDGEAAAGTEKSEPKVNNMAPWSGPNLNHVWPEDGKATAPQKFHPFIQTFHDWIVGSELIDGASLGGFVNDVSKFCQEMRRISGTQGWNGVNSSGREPFHKMHGEFVCAVLETVHFLVLTNFYSTVAHVEHAKALLERVLFPIIGTFEEIFDGDIDSDPGTLARTHMIERVLNNALDITMELISKYQENAVISKFLKDYQVLYSTLFHKDVTAGKSDKRKSFIPNYLGIVKKKRPGVKDFSGAIFEHKKCFTLTDPKYISRSFEHEIELPLGAIADKVLRRKLVSQPLRTQYAAIRTYLAKEIFDLDHRFPFLHKLKNEKGGEAPVFQTDKDDDESTLFGKSKTSFKDIFLNYGRRAPPGVATAAMNLLVRVFQQEKFFFDTCESSLILANPGTQRLYREVLHHARVLRLIVSGNLMNNDIADKVIASLNRVCDIVRNAKGVDDMTAETPAQKVCITEGLPQLMINMVCLQLDFKSAEEAEFRKSDAGNDDITPVEKMLMRAYTFLEHVSKGSITVQEMLYSSVDRLVASENSRVPIIAAHVAQSLIPTFQNPFFQARVRKFIPVICDAMSRLYEESQYVAEFLDLLKAMATPLDQNAEATIVTLNQAEIISYIMTKGTMSKELLTANDKKKSQGSTKETLDRSNGEKLGVRLGNAASLAEGIPIVHVDPSGQAHGKFAVGDVVTSINGNSVLGLSMAKAAKFMMASEQVDFELAPTAISTSERLFDDKKNHSKPPPKGSKESIRQDRQFIVSLVELLATCGQGNNVYIESISRGWLSDSDLIKALHAVIETDVGSPGTVILDTLDGKTLGLTLMKNPSTGKGAAIRALDDGGQAEATGKISVGQLITHVNGTDVTKMTMKEIATIIKSSNTIKIVLAVREGMLDEQLQMPRFKAFLTFFYHIYISDQCSTQIREPTPLISSPMVWSIMLQCQREIRNVFEIIGGNDERRPKEKATWHKQKDLVLNVCIPFLTRMLNAHVTKASLERMKKMKEDEDEVEVDLDDMGGESKDGVDRQDKTENTWNEAIEGGKMSIEDLKSDFDTLAKDLMEDIVNVSIPTDRDRWNQKYKPRHGQKLKALFEALSSTIEVEFQNAFHVPGKPNPWTLQRKLHDPPEGYGLVDAGKRLKIETGKKKFFSSISEAKAAWISIMLRENQKFDEMIVIRETEMDVVVNGKKIRKTMYGLQEGDDGQRTYDEHVNNHFQKYVQRIQDLDALQVEEHHCCHQPPPNEHVNSRNQRNPSCQYLKARKEGGLPCSSQFFTLTDVFRLALAEESDTNVRNKVHEKNVIFKHIEHLTFALTDRSLTDQKRLFLESIIVTMLRVVASLIASHRCDDMGSSLPVVSAERQAFRTDLGRTQLQLSASGGLSVAINLFRHERELVMKTAFMVFISLQENSPVEVQDAVFEAVRAGSAGPGFLRIQEELHRTLAVVSDNISHAEAKESAKKAKKNSAKAYLKKRSLLSLESSGAHMDAVEEFVAEHFGDYFEDMDADLKKQDASVEEKSLLAKDVGFDDGLNSGDAVWCREICNGLGKMVEGGHTDLKLALRETQGVNFVTELCAALEILPHTVSESDAARSSWLLLLQQIFYSLSEMCQGVPVNRQDAYDANLIKVITRVLELTVRKERVDVVKAQYQAISILHVMIENHDTETKMFAAKIVDQLPPHVLRRTINTNYLLYKFEDETEGAPDRIYMDSAFRCYFVMRKLSDLTGLNLEEATIPVWTPEAQHHEFHAITGRKKRQDEDGDRDNGHDNDGDRAARITRGERKAKSALNYIIATEETVESKVEYANREVQESDLLIFGRTGVLQSLIRAESKKRSNSSSSGIVDGAASKMSMIDQTKHTSRSSSQKVAGFRRKKSTTSRVSRASSHASSRAASPSRGNNVAARYSTATMWDEGGELIELEDMGDAVVVVETSSATKGKPVVEEVLEDDYGLFYNTFLDWRNSLSFEVPDRAIFFRAQTASVEFLRNKRLQKLYFRVPEDITVRLSQTFRDKILNEMSCDNAQEKVRDFLEVFPIVRAHLRRQQWLSSFKILRIFTDGTAPKWRFASLVLTYILCFMMLVAFKVDPNMEMDQQENTTYFPIEEGNSWYGTCLQVFGWMHVAVSFGVMLEYLVNNSASWSSLTFGGVLYYVLFFACSVAGVLMKGYFFGFHLLHVIQNNDTLNKAVSAVTHNGWVLWHIFFLIMKIIFIFSIFAFLFLRSDFNDADGMHCNSLRDCFATQLSTSLVLGGGMRELVPFDTFITNTSTSFEGNPHLQGRLFNDILFWIIVNVITMNLVLGVIVDTFGQLRQDRMAKAVDLASKCFICSLDSYNFLNVDGQFNRHIKKDHNMWDYVYFTMYLENTTVAQRTHHEIYLHQELMEKQSIKPFPVLRAMTLKQDVNEKDEAISELTDTCAKLKDRTEDIAKQMERLRTAVMAEIAGDDARDALADQEQHNEYKKLEDPLVSGFHSEDDDGEEEEEDPAF